MNNELKYIFKGMFYTCLLFVGIYIAYYIISSSKKSTVKKQLPIITYDDLMNTPEVIQGKALFTKNCEACHKLHAKDQFWFHNIVDNSYNKKVYTAGLKIATVL
jgi:hypothetical protein